MIELSTYKSGNYTGNSLGYDCFQPSTINGQWLWTEPKINQLLQEASIKLGELNSLSRIVPNVDIFIEMHVAKEAVKSSRIEGTQTHLSEAFMSEEEIIPSRLEDWQEVRNYVKAMNTGLESLSELPLSSRLFKKLHFHLLQSVRGKERQPGEYRSSQNWIGGASLTDAVFIPPQHSDIPRLMGDLENFIHNQDINVPELVRIAIAHYQFETIHPFLDGNGRLGRLMITLYLVSKNILDKPLLYLSSYLEKNKSLYYDNLMRVRTHGDMRQWIIYFLVGMRDTASKAVDTLGTLMDYKESTELMVRETMGRRASSALILLNYLFKNPVLSSVEKAAQICNCSYPSANNIVAKLQELGLLIEVTGQTRSRVFSFEPYIDILKD